MSIMSQEAKKGLGCVLHWSGEIAVSGTYDDDGNKRGFLILPDGVTVTPNGTFAVQKMKDGRNIWKFDGSTNYITISDHASWWFSSSPFTICFWIKTTSLSGTVGVMGQLPSNGGLPDTGFCMVLDNEAPRFYWYNGSVSAGYSSTTGSLSSGVWAFIVFVSTGATGTFYVNGINGGSVSINNIANSSLLFYIGAGQYTSWKKVAGNIKDLMIFKGKALTQDQIAAIMAETYIY